MRTIISFPLQNESGFPFIELVRKDDVTKYLFWNVMMEPKSLTLREHISYSITNEYLKMFSETLLNKILFIQ